VTFASKLLTSIISALGFTHVSSVDVAIGMEYEWIDDD